MNFERGLEVKEALDIGLKTVVIEFMGYNGIQPHNKEVIMGILKNPSMNDWDTSSPRTLRVYINPETKDDMIDNNVTYTYSGKYLIEKTLQELMDDRRIGFLQYKGQKYPI